MEFTKDRKVSILTQAQLKKQSDARLVSQERKEQVCLYGQQKEEYRKQEEAKYTHRTLELGSKAAPEGDHSSLCPLFLLHLK